MPTQEQIMNDINFWLGNQDREHMLFLQLGLQDAALKSEATQLLNAYTQAAQAGDTNALLNIAPRSQDLKTRCADRSNSGEWIGWLFPIFYEHIRREIDYALTRIQRDPTPQEEACFWTQIGAEHAIMAVQLLDPSEKEAQMLGFEEWMKLEKLHSQCTQQVMPAFVEMSRQAAVQLDNFFNTAKRAGVKSVIHPALADHIIREGQRFIETMNAVQSMSNGQGNMTNMPSTRMMQSAMASARMMQNNMPRAYTSNVRRNQRY